MRIVVVGLGKVGRALTAQLTAENNDIVVIDRNPDLIEDIVNIYDVRGLAGNGGCYDVQKEAFEDGADLLIATTSSDESNILACLVAKKLGTRLHVSATRSMKSSCALCAMTLVCRCSSTRKKPRRVRSPACCVSRLPSSVSSSAASGLS